MYGNPHRKSAVRFVVANWHGRGEFWRSCSMAENFEEVAEHGRSLRRMRERGEKIWERGERCEKFGAVARKFGDVVKNLDTRRKSLSKFAKNLGSWRENLWTLRETRHKERGTKIGKRGEGNCETIQRQACANNGGADPSQLKSGTQIMFLCLPW